MREVIYPVVSEAILQQLVDEFKASGTGYHEQVHHKQRGSYSHHYRRMLPEILDALDFQSNNQKHRPLIEATELLKRYSQSQQQYYPIEEEIPIEGVVPGSRQAFIIEKDQYGNTCINRINYELCVLDSLRDSLRCKEVWVPGADHYRNPDEDLPQDFDERREMYYEYLKQPLSADDFIARLKNLLHEALSSFNADLPNNPQVNLLKRNRGWIKLSPLKAQTEPTQLVYLKAEVDRRWHMISLLDMLKEADLLESLQGHIDLMHENINLAGIWVGNIIEGFEKYHQPMQTRHDIFFRSKKNKWSSSYGEHLPIIAVLFNL